MACSWLQLCGRLSAKAAAGTCREGRGAAAAAAQVRAPSRRSQRGRLLSLVKSAASRGRRAGRQAGAWRWAQREVQTPMVGRAFTLLVPRAVGRRTYIAGVGPRSWSTARREAEHSAQVARGTQRVASWQPWPDPCKSLGVCRVRRHISICAGPPCFLAQAMSLHLVQRVVPVECRVPRD